MALMSFVSAEGQFFFFFFLWEEILFGVFVHLILRQALPSIFDIRKYSFCIILYGLCSSHTFR